MTDNMRRKHNQLFGLHLNFEFEKPNIYVHLLSILSILFYLYVAEETESSNLGGNPENSVIIILLVKAYVVSMSWHTGIYPSDA